MGDATNMVIVLAGEMLKMAEGLIRIGLHPSDIAAGYEKAQEFALKTLEGIVCPRTPRNGGPC
jgi:T-complex protein 1 subunit theta